MKIKIIGLRGEDTLSFLKKQSINMIKTRINYENDTHENNNKKVFLTMEIESFTGLRLNQPVYGFINKSSHATKLLYT